MRQNATMVPAISKHINTMSASAQLPKRQAKTRQAKNSQPHHGTSVQCPLPQTND